MRNVLYGAACSLDGFIAGPDDGVEWLHWSGDVAAISNDVWSSTDTVIMGRRTWEIARQNGTEAYPGVQNYVFARTGRIKSSKPNLTVISTDAPAFVHTARISSCSNPGRCNTTVTIFAIARSDEKRRGNEPAPSVTPDPLSRIARVGPS